MLACNTPGSATWTVTELGVTGRRIISCASGGHFPLWIFEEYLKHPLSSADLCLCLFHLLIHGTAASSRHHCCSLPQTPGECPCQRGPTSMGWGEFTVLQHFSATLLYNIPLQHPSPTLLYNTLCIASLQPSSLQRCISGVTVRTQHQHKQHEVHFPKKHVRIITTAKSTNRAQHPKLPIVTLRYAGVNHNSETPSFGESSNKNSFLAKDSGPIYLSTHHNPSLHPESSVNVTA